MKHAMAPILVLFLSLASAPAHAHPGHGQNAETAFASILHHYEAVWEILARDTHQGAAEHAAGIRQAAEAITADFSARSAGLRDEISVDEVKAFFDKIAIAATDLEAATEVDWAREAFYDISKPMVRLNGLLRGEKLKVIYCSMAKKSWLQRHEQIANPYHGQAMSDCGEIVG